VQVIALTDHDSTEGIAEARRAAERWPGFTLISGVEMGTDIPGAEVHVVGLFLEPENEDLQKTLRWLRDSRVVRAQRMVEKLRVLGYDITWEQVLRFAGDARVGRPHVAHALVEKGYIENVSQAFEGLIDRNGIAYVEREKMTPAEAVACIVRLGGVPILAHPADLENLDRLLPELKAAGLAGMEVYYKDYDEATMARLRETADRFGLLPGGGTDFHGIFGEGEPLPGDIPLPDWVTDRILELGAEAKARRAASR
jgi:predicted metal-dependent phosphoesterase TrpH